MRGENAALRVELAELKGDEKTLKARVDAATEEVRGILAREHTEAEARGKLRSRVEYIVGTLEGRADDG